MFIYLIGSLRNPAIPRVAKALRDAGHEVVEEWYAAGERADDAWRAYEKGRGRTYPEALAGLAARHIFEFDRHHLERCEAAVLVQPAGKSGHLELGWALGRGKRGYVLLDGDPERWDVMLNFADGVFETVEELLCELNKTTKSPSGACGAPLRT